MRALQPQDLIDGLRIVRPLGQGGMGSVYLAHDLALDRPTALKVIRAEAPSAALRQRFLTEARALARLQHRNVVGVYRFGEVDGHPYLAYEFVEGQGLDQVREPMPWPRALQVGMGLAAGVAAAHAREVLHRDIKPSNVLLTASGEVKLLDFGLAVLDGPEAGQTLEGRVAGTPAYVAPERWYGATASPLADIWAMGMVLRVLLTGRHPLEGAPPLMLPALIAEGDLNPVGSEVRDLPRPLGELVDRCLARDPRRRPPTAAAVLETLRALDVMLGAYEVSADATDTPTRVAASFQRVAPQAQQLGDRFYSRLFAAHPAVRPLFPSDMTGQRDKLVGALVLVVDNLRNPDVLVPALRDLGARHRSYGVIRAHFDAVHDALFATLAEFDRAWSPSVAAAWEDAWGRLLQGMLLGLAEADATIDLPAPPRPAPSRPPSGPAVTVPPGPPPSSAPPAPDLSLLPTPITRFFGREDELGTLAGMVRGGARLVTLLGMGGVGKTRLALELTRRLATTGDWARVAWVPLADAADRGAALQAMFRGFAFKEILGDPLTALARALSSGRALMVLDNLERLVDLLAEDLSTLLERTPGLTLVVTSQRPLDLYGEVIYRLGPLEVPDPDIPWSELQQAPALRLLIDRARLTRPGFTLDEVSGPLAAALIARLDGLPLALELAAARAGSIDLGTLVARLETDLGVLSDRSRNRPERQRSLSAALRWTVDLLPAEHRALYAALSVFPGAFDAGDVSAVTDVTGVEELLEDLARSSLLVPLDDAPGRYRSLSTVRAYAASLLSPDEAARLQDRFRAHYIGLAIAWADGMATPRSGELTTRLDRAWPSLMAALNTATTHQEAEVLGRTPVHVLWSGRFAEVLPRFDRFVPQDVYASLTPTVRATLVRAGHRLSLVGADPRRLQLWYGRIAGCLQEEIPARERMGLESELVVTAIDRGQFATATALVERHIAQAREIGDRRNLAVNLDSRARVALFKGDEVEAAAYGAEAWEHAQVVGDPQLRDVILVMRLNLAVTWEHRAEAEAAYRAVKAQRAAHGRPHDDVTTLHARAMLTQMDGRLDDAWNLVVTAERAYRAQPRAHLVALTALAQVAYARGDDARVVAETTRSVQIMEELGRYIELPQPAILRARALRRMGDPGARAALEDVTRRVCALEGWRHVTRLLEAWREARPDLAWPDPGPLSEERWRGWFDERGAPTLPARQAVAR